MAVTGPVKRLVVRDTYPRLGQSVSLALKILSHTRRESMQQLRQAVTAYNEEVLLRLAEIDITEEQVRLLNGGARVLELLRVPTTRGVGGGTLTVSICDTCGRWVFAGGPGGKAADGKCVVTFGCGGQMVKISPAKFEPILTRDEPTQDNDDDDDDDDSDDGGGRDDE